MSHFAKINNIDNQYFVEQIIIAEQDFINTLPGEWVQTSYNTFGGKHYGIDKKPDVGVALRKNFATQGCIYDKELDAFYIKQPFNGWVLNKETCLWEPPFAKPDDGKTYSWNTDLNNWILVEQLTV